MSPDTDTNTQPGLLAKLKALFLGAAGFIKEHPVYLTYALALAANAGVVALNDAQINAISALAILVITGLAAVIATGKVTPLVKILPEIEEAYEKVDEVYEAASEQSSMGFVRAKTVQAHDHLSRTKARLEGGAKHKKGKGGGSR